jgi:hypothetical protein
LGWLAGDLHLLELFFRNRFEMARKRRAHSNVLDAQNRLLNVVDTLGLVLADGLLEGSV